MASNFQVMNPAVLLQLLAILLPFLLMATFGDPANCSHVRTVN